MSGDNEYIAKEEKKGVRKKRSSKKKTKAKSKKASDNPFAKIQERFSQRKVKTTIGALLILLSFYLFLAFFSNF